MPAKLKHYAVLTAVMLLLMTLFFGKAVWQPNAYLLNPWGDGATIYYNAAYYVKYDGGFWQQGMNYPYGEHVIYAANQPAITIPLNFIDDHIVPISDYTIGIINFFSFFSLLLCALLLLKLLTFYRVSPWIGVLAAVILTFLNPQVPRLTGHYSLIYCFFIPLLWWWHIQMNRKERPWLWMFLIVFTIFFFGMAHVYFLALGIFFFGAFLLVQAIQSFSKKKWNLLAILRNVLIVCLPFLIFKIIMILTDPVNDRTPAPWGFFENRAYFEGVFLPQHNDFLTAIKAAQFKNEGYVGITGLLILIYVLIKWVNYIRRRQYKKLVLPALPGGLSLYIWSGTLILLFSMAIPFKFGLEGLLDLIPALKQFRALSRFTYVFYFTFTVFGVVYLFMVYRKLRMKGLKVLAVSFMALHLLFWSLDSYTLVRNVIPWLPMTENQFLEDSYMEKLEKAGHQPEDFQTIMAFPFYNLGSEKLYIDRGASSILQSCLASYQTGLPIAQLYLARTSISRTFNLAQLLSDDLITKEVLEDFKNEKPVLAIRINPEKISPQAEQLLQKADTILIEEYISLYSIPLSAFSDKKMETEEAFHSMKDSLYQYNGVYTSAPERNFIYCHFDSMESPVRLVGKGGYYRMKGPNTLYSGTIPSAEGGMYETSVWLKSHENRPAFPYLQYEQVGHSTGEVIEHRYIDSKVLTNIYKEWVLVQFSFYLYDLRNEIRFYSDEDYLIADELLLRPEGMDVYYVSQEGAIVKNNFIVTGGAGEAD